MNKEEELEKREKAFRANTGEEYYDLALYYDEANDKEPNKYSFRSLYFYFRAGQLGYADGYNGIGTLISSHDGVKNNITRARDYFKQAIEKGSYCAKLNYFLTLNQEEYPTCLKLVVTVTGDKLDSARFSELVGISPTNFWLKGDDTTQYPYSLGRKKTCWQYEFDNLITRDLAPLVDLFKESFGTKVDIISKYIQENDLMMELDVIADINYGIIPSYYMDKEFMSLLVQMNADINFEQEYFEGFVDDYADWLKEQKIDLIENDKLLRAFQDKEVTKFVYDNKKRRIELSFDGYYDSVKGKEINSSCLLIIDEWDEVKNKLDCSIKNEGLSANLAVISNILSISVVEDSVNMVVGTTDGQQYEITFKKEAMWLCLDFY
ncbi:DUF4279 domain-containing protein [Myroides odoratimimus]|uniref:Sel1 repeat protein n=1 Tax=Myroides odoratimimus CIP 101113 TaxID=883154 RepID=A0AAV3F6U8_9FLAO|nr:DUF4279 domain-containing protein [Myroides odoratimimus]EHO15091.1 hypothetical protein HMPREF9715_00279 [Myroides odoratimimus CIP 101113]EKB04518.1 hypothetical protein HMPREF9711_01847 [Myroides odoratimimus CCUG 3837]EPH10526.1 hypothetical protein HMPREF9713_02338 [Myroides odoratimimus CCUG 12700]MCO7721717.1 DUF4279 domain-containing protein [Myroides odoratimimus]SHK93848.1 protein of unknown function [Myroides odoratimimus subsp. xuanwuensis]